MLPTASSSVLSRAAALLPVLMLAMVLPPAAGQVPFLGGCPHKEVVQNFNVSAYLGTWYEQERYFAVFQLGGNCVTATYTDEGNGVVGVLNRQTNLITSRKSEIKGTAQLANGTEGKLEVRFPSAGNFPAPYWILDTDYDNYAIVWSCNSVFGFGNVQFAWVLTRVKNPPGDVMARLKESLEARQVALGPFRRTLQVCDDN